MSENKIESKIDKLQEDVSEIKTHLAVYNSQLEIHIKRSDLLEQKLEPVEKHVNMVNGALKLIGVLATIAAIIEVAIQITK